MKVDPMAILSSADDAATESKSVARGGSPGRTRGEGKRRKSIDSGEAPGAAASSTVTLGRGTDAADANVAAGSGDAAEQPSFAARLAENLEAAQQDVRTPQMSGALETANPEAEDAGSGEVAGRLAKSSGGSDVIRSAGDRERNGPERGRASAALSHVQTQTLAPQTHAPQTHVPDHSRSESRAEAHAAENAPTGASVSTENPVANQVGETDEPSLVSDRGAVPLLDLDAIGVGAAAGRGADAHEQGSSGDTSDALASAFALVMSSAADGERPGRVRSALGSFERDGAARDRVKRDGVRDDRAIAQPQPVTAPENADRTPPPLSASAQNAPGLAPAPGSDPTQVPGAADSFSGRGESSGVLLPGVVPEQAPAIGLASALGDFRLHDRDQTGSQGAPGHSNSPPISRAELAPHRPTSHKGQAHLREGAAGGAKPATTRLAAVDAGRGDQAGAARQPSLAPQASGRAADIFGDTVAGQPVVGAATPASPAIAGVALGARSLDAPMRPQRADARSNGSSPSGLSAPAAVPAAVPAGATEPNLIAERRSLAHERSAARLASFPSSAREPAAVGPGIAPGVAPGMAPGRALNGRGVTPSVEPSQVSSASPGAPNRAAATAASVALSAAPSATPRPTLAAPTSEATAPLRARSGEPSFGSSSASPPNARSPLPSRLPSGLPAASFPLPATPPAPPSRSAMASAGPATPGSTTPSREAASVIPNETLTPAPAARRSAPPQPQGTSATIATIASSPASFVAPPAPARVQATVLALAHAPRVTKLAPEPRSSSSSEPAVDARSPRTPRAAAAKTLAPSLSREGSRIDPESHLPHVTPRVMSPPSRGAEPPAPPALRALAAEAALATSRGGSAEPSGDPITEKLAAGSPAGKSRPPVEAQPHRSPSPASPAPHDPERAGVPPQVGFAPRSPSTSPSVLTTQKPPTLPARTPPAQSPPAGHAVPTFFRGVRRAEDDLQVVESTLRLPVAPSRASQPATPPQAQAEPASPQASQNASQSGPQNASQDPSANAPRKSVARSVFGSRRETDKGSSVDPVSTTTGPAAAPERPALPKSSQAPRILPSVAIEAPPPAERPAAETTNSETADPARAPSRRGLASRRDVHSEEGAASSDGRERAFSNAYGPLVGGRSHGADVLPTLARSSSAWGFASTAPVGSADIPSTRSPGSAEARDGAVRPGEPPAAQTTPSGSTAPREPAGLVTLPAATPSPTAALAHAQPQQGPSPEATFSAAAFAAGLPAAARPLFDQAAEDPSLRGATLGKSAHLTLETPGAGELSLHLRVRDGVADVRVDGAAARSLDIRPDDLRTALAGEGLSLGSFDAGPATTYAPSSPVAPTHDGHTLDSAPGGSGTGGGGATGEFSGSSSQQFGQHQDEHREGLDRREATPANADVRRIPSARAAALGSSSNNTDPAPARRGVHVTA